MTAWHQKPLAEYRAAVFAALSAKGHLTQDAISSAVLERAHRAAHDPGDFVSYLATLDHPQQLTPEKYYQDRVRFLNYLARTAMGVACIPLRTAGIKALPECDQSAIIETIETLTDADFEPENDPYKEQDFMTIEHNGHKIFAKIDYYDNDLEQGSEDPTNPHMTKRVLTIMLAHEY